MTTRAVEWLDSPVTEWSDTRVARTTECVNREGGTQ
jgi:hypothetical protein